MKKKNKKTAPKLPRFVAPKDMTSKVFVDKKTKAKRKRNKSWIDFADEAGDFS